MSGISLVFRSVIWLEDCLFGPERPGIKVDKNAQEASYEREIEIFISIPEILKPFCR
jgi:hypothetical protein